MLMKPIDTEKAVHGCQCLGDMAVRTRKVLARPWIGVESAACFYCCFDPYFTLWPIFASVTHFPKCPTLASLTHFSNCDPFYQVRPIFVGVTHFSNFDSFFYVWHVFFKCEPFSYMLPIFYCVTHFFKRKKFFYVTLSSSVTYFLKCDSIFQVGPILNGWNIFSKCDAFFYLWTIFLSVTFFCKCDPFWKCDNFFV